MKIKLESFKTAAKRDWPYWLALSCSMCGIVNEIRMAEYVGALWALCTLIFVLVHIEHRRSLQLLEDELSVMSEANGRLAETQAKCAANEILIRNLTSENAELRRRLQSRKKKEASHE